MLPSSFTLTIQHAAPGTYRLSAAQVLPLPRKDAFVFFEDPRNLFDITPEWLNFIMKDREQMTGMYDGAVFDYTIRWFGIPLSWRRRIEGYRPPEQFIDVQAKGPYRSWSHLHRFEDHPGGTLMKDIVTYRLPFGPLGRTAHRVAVRRQLERIFRYRASRIDEWARGVLVHKCHS